MAFDLQQLFFALVVRHNFFYNVPKLWGMVHLQQMGEFVHDDIISYVRWCKKQTNGKVEVAVSGAAAECWLTNKYQSLEDAKEMLGDVANISRLFIEFQEHLYKQKAAS